MKTKEYGQDLILPKEKVIVNMYVYLMMIRFQDPDGLKIV